jgi:hypothetical protein
MLITTLLLVTALVTQAGQAPTRIINPTGAPTTGDARTSQFDFEVPGTSWRVFSINSNPDPEGPLVITQVEEVKQQNPPSAWAVFVGNRESQPVASLTIAAAVVDVNGKVKATQVMPAIKNLKPQQVQRREMKVRVTVLAPTDRVVFYIKDFKGDGGDWAASEEFVVTRIKDVAAKLPVP